MSSVPLAAGESVQQLKSKSSSYIAGLDGIRAIAFFLVFFAHTVWGRAAAFVPATLGVTIFFFLSGYLITTLLRREFAKTRTIGLKDFYIRRALRILVPLYLVYGLAEVVARYVVHKEAGTWQGFLSMVFYYFNYGYALGSVGFGLNIFSPGGMSIIWSLCIEEHFYFIFPVVFLAMSRSKLSEATKRNLLIGFCVLELAWRVVRVVLHFRGIQTWNYYATDARLDSILWGSVLAMFWNPLFGDRTLLPRKSPQWGFAAALLVMLVSLAIPGSLYRNAFRVTLQAVALLYIFTFVVMDTRHWSVRWLEHPVMRYLGWTSYVLYLSHYMFFSVFEHYTPNPLLRLVGTLAATLLFATLMRYTVELPLQRWRAKFRRVPEHDRGAADGHGLIS